MEFKVGDYVRFKGTNIAFVGVEGIVKNVYDNLITGTVTKLGGEDCFYNYVGEFFSLSKKSLVVISSSENTEDDIWE